MHSRDVDGGAPNGRFRRVGSGAFVVDDEIGLPEANLSSCFENVERLRQDGGEKRRSRAGEKVDL